MSYDQQSKKTLGVHSPELGSPIKLHLTPDLSRSTPNSMTELLYFSKVLDISLFYNT